MKSITQLIMKHTKEHSKPLCYITLRKLFCKAFHPVYTENFTWPTPRPSSSPSFSRHAPWRLSADSTVGSSNPRGSPALYIFKYQEHEHISLTRLVRYFWVTFNVLPFSTAGQYVRMKWNKQAAQERLYLHGTKCFLCPSHMWPLDFFAQFVHLNLELARDCPKYSIKPLSKSIFFTREPFLLLLLWWRTQGHS